MDIEKVCKDETACIFKIKFRFNQVWTYVLPLRLSYFKNKINFLSKMLETENNVIIYLFDQLGRDELHRICNNFNFNRNYCNKFVMTEHFFQIVYINLI